MKHTQLRSTRTQYGPPRAGGGSPPSARYDATAAWPGITAGFDARCWGCTWSTKDGVYQIKNAHSLCEVPEHRRAVG